MQPQQQDKLPDLSKEEIFNIVELCYNDPVEFCKTFLFDQFPKPMPWVHRGLLALVLGKTDFLLKYGELEKIANHFTWREDPSNEDSDEHPMFILNYNDEGKVVSIDLHKPKYTEIIMPRGFSKTTLIGLAAILYKILFKERKFVVYVSETATAAELQLGNVKHELATNELIHLCFGVLKPDRNSETRWTNGFIQTTTGICVTARGRGGQIRGLNVGGQRPDEILCDDVEDKESVRTGEQREKTRDWFYSDLMPALPAMDPDATITCLGTVLHSEALLMVLKNDPDFATVVFGAIDRDGEPLWADNMNLKDLENKKKSYALAGMLAQYYMEYESTLRPSDGAKFNGPFLMKPEWMGELDCRAMVADPAISEKVGADFFALAVGGMTTRGHILVIDVWMKRGVPPDEQVDIFFKKSKQWEVEKHGIEGIAYQRALIHMVRQEMFRRGQYFVIEDIKHGNTAKDERINAILQPRYANGYIGHRVRFPEYETQLLDFPDGKKDGPDAVAMMITLLDPYAANAADPEKDLEADEYEPQKEWRPY